MSGVLAASLAVPAGAAAQDPTPQDFKNAAKYCKALKKASGSNFASMFGTKKNAYGKCVSSTAKQKAKQDEQQEREAKSNAAKQCKAERSDQNFAASHGGKSFNEFYGTNKNGKNAYGKCVSQKAKANKDQADKEEAAADKAKTNAAKKCKAQRKEDPSGFAEQWGTRRNAFGKCVSATARSQSEQYVEQS